MNPLTPRLERLTRIERDLAARLTAWPGTSVTIRTRVDDLAKILVNGLILSVDDGHETDLAEKGDGIQRQILFRVFQLYADYRAERGVFMPGEGEAPVERGPSIITFEEPELFLHPQAQDQFYDDLITVSETDQVLLATHSSHLIRLTAPMDCILSGAAEPSATSFTTADPDWIDAGDRQRLKEIALCSGDVSKVFFADRVVVTEGQEDVIYVLGTAAEHANCLNRQVTVVQAGGKERIPPLQKVLNAFGIPYIVACDRDPGNANSGATSERIEELVRAANAGMGQSHPSSTLTLTFRMFVAEPRNHPEKSHITRLSSSGRVPTGDFVKECAGCMRFNETRRWGHFDLSASLLASAEKTGRAYFPLTEMCFVRFVSLMFRGMPTPCRATETGEPCAATPRGNGPFFENLIRKSEPTAIAAMAELAPADHSGAQMRIDETNPTFAQPAASLGVASTCLDRRPH